MPIPDHDNPPVTASRRGLRLRHTDGGKCSYFEVAEPGELERIRPDLTKAEFDAGIQLRPLWAQGTLLAAPSASCLDRLGMPRRGYHADPADEHRCEAQDRLRAAMRAMGGLGIAGASRSRCASTSAASRQPRSWTRCARRWGSWQSICGRRRLRLRKKEPRRSRGKSRIRLLRLDLRRCPRSRSD
jgi:hypothetical protein